MKFIDDDGTIRYYLDDKRSILHREGGPAVEDANGDKSWYIHGKRHRLDGPAVEYADGSKLWYINGDLHRLDGPALERADGTKYWYYENNLIDCKTQEEFEKIIKLKPFW